MQWAAGPALEAGIQIAKAEAEPDLLEISQLGPQNILASRTREPRVVKLCSIWGEMR